MPVSANRDPRRFAETFAARAAPAGWSGGVPAESDDRAGQLQDLGELRGRQDTQRLVDLAFGPLAVAGLGPWAGRDARLQPQKVQPGRDKHGEVGWFGDTTGTAIVDVRPVHLSDG